LRKKRGKPSLKPLPPAVHFDLTRIAPHFPGA
jgi:hypothetical protein